MTKTPQPKDRPSNQSETLRELFSEKKDDFVEALECLYIRNNQGGRLMFAEKWPVAAEKIFSEELVRFDHQGAESEEDRVKRAELEEKSEVLRDEMLQIFHNLAGRLVIYGSLQVEELEKVMQKIDRPLAEYIFADRFVDKYFPTAPEAKVESRSGEQGSHPERRAETRSDRQTDQPRAKQEDAPLHKEVVEVEEVQTGSIGHVDHSFSTSTPDYKEGEDGEDSEDMSWLNTIEEDEFGDVQPISTDNAPPKPPAVDQTVPQNAVSAPKEIGLKEYRDNHGDDDVAVPPPEEDEPEAGLFDAVRGEGADQEGNQKIDVPEAPSIEEPAKGQEPQPEAPRKPMGMEGAHLAQQERSRPQEPALEQPLQPPPNPSGDNSAPPSRPPMGMGAIRQDQNPPQSEPAAPTPEDQPKPEGDAASSAPEEKKEKKPAPRVPSLDDIDKHMPGSGSKPGNTPSGFPPIPGSEDD